MKKWRRLLSTLAVLASTVLLAPAAQAADHLDAPAARADAAADINDLFVFRSDNAANGNGTDRTVLILTVHPQAEVNSRFSDAVSYNFHLTDGADTANNATINCTFDNEVVQTMSCTVNGVSTLDGATIMKEANDATDGSRLLGASTGIILYAGYRDDPFFFDFEAFQDVYDSVLAGTPDPTPLVDADDMGTDFFAPLNTLAIVVDIENVALPGYDGTNVYSVWASTTRLAAQ